MNKRTLSILLSAGAAAASFFLYLSTRSALTPPPAAMLKVHAFWAYWLDVFGGDVAVLTAVFAALGIGIGTYFIVRYFDWRLGIAAAVFAMFLPGYWNAATRGGIIVFKAGWVMLALLVLDSLAWKVVARVRQLKAVDGNSSGTLVDGSETRAPARWHAVLHYSLIGAAAVFAIWSAAMNHEYRYGLAQQVYEADIVEAAKGRWIVELKGGDDESRHALVERVKQEFPEDKELQALAQIGERAFFDAALKKHPDKFYLKATAGDNWSERWGHVKDYLAVRDPFIPRMRRLFAYEGNALANRRQDEGRADEAWALYRRIYDEIEPDNFSALVNMSEMIRRGYEANQDDVQRVKLALDNFFKNKTRAAHAREIALVSGPVRADEKLIEQLREAAQKRMEEMKKNHEPLPVPPELKQLVDWNNEMVAAADKGDMASAGRIARTILSNPKWRGFIPANAILGSQLGEEGDFEASERFFRVAVATTNAIPPAVMNDFAETLRRQRKFDEAETWARKAIAAAPEKFWVARLTLAEVLIDAGVKLDEAKALLEAVSAIVPLEAKKTVRAVQKRLPQ